ncbi:MAG: hypothetical protein Q7R62_01855 [bacterium]|nr:hypothetical protein [bacterium]
MAKQKSGKKDQGDLVQFLGVKFDHIEERFENLEGMFRELQGSVDAYAKRADAYFQEMTMLSIQVRRHDRWLQEIADKLKIKLSR